MSPRHDVEVEIEFLPTDLGGRTGPVSSGYRPQLYYNGHDWDASHEYPDTEQVRPGDHVRAYLTCMSPQFHDGKLVPGKAVLFREGHRVVAFGTVTRVVDLARAAYRARLEEFLTSYYRALGEVAEQAHSSDQRDLCEAELAATFSLRQHLREASDVPDLGDFLSKQAALTEALGPSGSSIVRPLDELRSAVTR